MRYCADLHIHTDHNPNNGSWHGDRPENIARGIVESGIDVFAITEHNAVSDRYFQVLEEVERLMDGKGREILGLLGTEMTVTFERHNYHVGYVFEGPFNGGLPETPPARSNLQDLEQYRDEYPGVAILNHPTWKDHKRANDSAITENLMQSGLVDGVEVLNGSILHNGADDCITKSALEMYARIRKTNGHRFLAAMACSDAHVGLGHMDRGSRENLVGVVATEFTRGSIEEIFDAIRSAETVALCRSETSKRALKRIMKPKGYDKIAPSDLRSLGKSIARF